MRYQIRDMRFCRDCWFQPNHRQDYLERKTELEASLRDNLRELQKTTCALCKVEVVDATPRVHFEFDHVDLGSKKFNVGCAIMQLQPLEEILQEIEGCRLLCDRCHSVVTRVQQLSGASSIPQRLLLSDALLNQEVQNKVRDISLRWLHSLDNAPIPKDT